MTLARRRSRTRSARSAISRSPRAGRSAPRTSRRRSSPSRSPGRDGLTTGGTVTFLGPDGPVALPIAGVLAGDGPLGRERRADGRAAARDDAADPRRRNGQPRRRPRRPGRDDRRDDRCDRRRPDRPAVRPVVAGRHRRVAPELDRGLPLDDRPDRGGRAVRRGVPDLQHAVDDRDRARPRAGAAAGGRGDTPPADRVRPRPGGRPSAWPGRRWGSSSASSSPS